MKTSVFSATLAVVAISLVAADPAGLKIVDLSQTGDNSTGTGQVSAAGSLEPFGGLGLGCGINWAKDSSFGGGLQAGTDAFGLGGGFTVTDETMAVGLGLGVSSILNSSVSLNATKTGAVSFIFAASSAFTCEKTVVDGMDAIKCTTAA